jgi:hypothetical protein
MRDREQIAPFKRFDELDDSPIQYRIPGLLTEQGNVLISAYRKMGKTSLILDLAIALTSSRNFLGQLECMELDGPLVYINLELLEPMLRMYLDDLGIKQNNDMLLSQDYRGRSTSFNLGDPDWRDKYADVLYKEGAKALIVDPIHPLLVSGGADSNNNDESRYTVELLGEIARHAELDHLFVVDHTGHADKSRARGASGKEDWADILWNINSDDQTGAYRTLNVTGRGANGSARYMMKDKELVITSGGSNDHEEAPKEVSKPTPMGVIRDYMAREDRPLTVQAICSATGFSQPTVSRVLSDAITLVEKLPEKEGKAPLWRLIGHY